MKSGLPAFAEDRLALRGEIIDRAGNNVLYLARLVAPSFMISYSFSAYFKKVHGRIVDGKLLAALFSVAFLVMISTSSRSDVFFILFMTLLISYLSSKALNIRKLFIASASIALAIFFLGYLRVMNALPDRLEFYLETAETWGFPLASFSAFAVYAILQLSVYTGNILEIISLVPEYLDHFHGRNFLITLSTVLPGKQITTGEILKDAAGLDFLGGGLNPTMLGELYLDNGVWYIGIMMFVYGVLYRISYTFLLERYSPSAILIHAYFTFTLVVSVLGGLFAQISRWYY